MKTSFIEETKTLTAIIIAFVALLIFVFILVLLYRRHLKTKYARYLEPNKNFVVSIQFFIEKFHLNLPPRAEVYTKDHGSRRT